MDEVLFAETVGRGGVVDGSGDRIDAKLIRDFCVRRAGEVDPRGIRLRGVTVARTLDLTGVDLTFALRFEECTFEAAPVVHGAHMRELAFVGCTLPGLLANGIEVRGDLDLSRSVIVGRHRTTASMSRSAAVWLCESSVGGRLLCVDTVIDPQGERAVQADRMQVGGTVRLLGGFEAKGELRLVGLRVAGSFDLAGARVTSAGVAIDLADATIAGNMFVVPADSGRRPEVRGSFNLSSARIDGTMLVNDATLTGAVRASSRYDSPRLLGWTLVGQRLAVGAEFLIGGDTSIVGGVCLASAELGRFSIGAGGSVDAAGQPALDLTNAEVRSSVALGEGVHVRGAILLVGARIRGRLDLDGITLTDPDGHSLLKADGATIEGDVELKALRATGGQLKFWRTTIGGGVDAAGAVIHNPRGGTLRLHQSEIRGSVRLVDGFTSTGCVVLSRTTAGGRLDVSGGRFTCARESEYNPEGAAIRAVAATFRGGMDLGWASITPAVNLTDVTTTVLHDDPSTWPERIYIAGFTYERFDTPREGEPARIWDWRRRVAWLHQQPEYDAGPYEQAARVFRQHGYEDGAEELLIRRRKDARAAEARSGTPGYRLRNLVDWIYDWTVGYGFRPGRVLWLLVALLTLVTATLAVPVVQQTMRATDEGVVFTIKGPIGEPSDEEEFVDPCGGGRVRCFNPVLYAVDTVVPLIALEQRATWYPDRFVAWGAIVEWWLNIATVIGWLLSSIFLLSFARLARNA